MILSGSGFKSTNILKINSRAACASFFGPANKKVKNRIQIFKHSNENGLEPNS
jgi:hypothetical protein